jgi:hypothetical protein
MLLLFNSLVFCRAPSAKIRKKSSVGSIEPSLAKMLGGVEPSGVAHRHEMYIISAMYEVSLELVLHPYLNASRGMYRGEATNVNILQIQ